MQGGHSRERGDVGDCGQHYNRERAHSRLGFRNPNEFKLTKNQAQDTDSMVHVFLRVQMDFFIRIRVSCEEIGSLLPEFFQTENVDFWSTHGLHFDSVWNAGLKILIQWYTFFDKFK